MSRLAQRPLAQRSLFLAPLTLALAAWTGCATSGVADNLDEAGTPDDDAGDLPSARDAGIEHTVSFDADPGPGFDATPFDSSPVIGDGAAASCVATNTCLAADDLGAVSGDTGGTVSATGFSSKWMTVKVTEDSNSARDLKVNVVLTSPTGANFDLFLYVDTGGSPTDRACTTVSQSSTNASGTDNASLRWGEGSIVPNGNDDTRIVTVEVRYISGNCAPGSKWTLTATGN